MRITVSEFQTMGVSLLERACDLGEEVAIVDAGVVIARLVPEPNSTKPWHLLRGAAVITGDLTAPIMTEKEVSDASQFEAAILKSAHGH
jgi:antitoxin (DNA-binding transcriptional repressor) of toxin-antitoxin stability system